MVLKTRLVKEQKKRLVPNLTQFFLVFFTSFHGFVHIDSRSSSQSVWFDFKTVI